MKIMVDNNIILDVILDRKEFIDESSKILNLLLSKNIQGFITVNNLTNIFYIVKRALHDSLKAKEVIRNLMQLFYLVDVTSYDAIKSFDYNTKDYEDNLLSTCALRSNCDYIITRNIKDFLDSKVKAILPSDFLKIIDYNL